MAKKSMFQSFATASRPSKLRIGTVIQEQRDACIAVGLTVDHVQGYLVPYRMSQIGVAPVLQYECQNLDGGTAGERHHGISRVGAIAWEMNSQRVAWIGQQRMSDPRKVTCKRHVRVGPVSQ